MFMIKAIVAGIVAGAGAFSTAFADGAITGAEGGVICLAAVAGFVAVYSAPANKPKPPAA